MKYITNSIIVWLIAMLGISSSIADEFLPPLQQDALLVFVGDLDDGQPKKHNKTIVGMYVL